MHKQNLHPGRRWLLTLAVAATLTLSLSFGQAAVGKLFGADWTPTAYACESPGGGC